MDRLATGKYFYVLCDLTIIFHSYLKIMFCNAFLLHMMSRYMLRIFLFSESMRDQIMNMTLIAKEIFGKMFNCQKQIPCIQFNGFVLSLSLSRHCSTRLLFFSFTQTFPSIEKKWRFKEHKMIIFISILPSKLQMF